MSYLEFKNVYFNDGENIILKDINFSLEKGDFISIVGPSGSGKSTLLKLCCGLISPSKGNIYYDGKDIESSDAVEIRREICYCFQTPYLFGKTVMNNLSFPYSIRNMEINMDRIYELFNIFKMDKEFIYKEILNLSGGEKQRIALIRSLAVPPKILLLDEVTSALDTENTAIVESVIKKLNDNGMTILWITHNPEQSRRNANKLLTIDGGEIKSMEVIA